MLHRNIFRFTKPDLDTMQGYKKVKSKPYLKVKLLTFLYSYSLELAYATNLFSTSCT